MATPTPPTTRKRSSSAFESLSPFSSRASTSSSSSTAPTSPQSPITVKYEPLSIAGPTETLAGRVYTQPRAKRPRAKPDRYSPSALTPSRSESSSSAKPVTKGSRRQNKELSPGVYVVAHILARSFAKGYMDGKHEYQYLVRWEGYGLGDDTWQMESTLRDGSERLLKEFKSRLRPFTILDARGIGGGLKYLVRYCFDSPTVPASPLAPQGWHGAKEIMRLSGADEGTVRTAIADFEYARRGYRVVYNLPNISALKSQYPSLLKGRRGSQVEQETNAELIQILDRQNYIPPRAVSSKFRGVVYNYLVKYRQGTEVVDEWMRATTMWHLFGKDAAARAREEFIGSRQATSGPKWQSSGPSDYEDARSKNIEENQALMKQLGF